MKSYAIVLICVTLMLPVSVNGQFFQHAKAVTTAPSVPDETVTITVEWSITITETTEVIDLPELLECYHSFTDWLASVNKQKVMTAFASDHWVPANHQRVQLIRHSNLSPSITLFRIN
jgi:hypothetical protein